MFYFVFINMEFKKKDLLLTESKSEDGLVKKVLDKFQELKKRTKSEFKETKALIRILTHAVKSYSKDRDFDLDEKDKKFIKEQSTDVVKDLMILIISLIPIPIPVTPFLVIFGNKIGIDILPKEQEIPHKGKSKKEKRMEIVVSEQQFELLQEMSKRYKSRLQRLCFNQKENRPFCQLYKMNETLTEDDQIRLDYAIEVLDRYFRFKNVGMFPKIVELSLQDPSRTVTFLILIADFIEDETYDDTETKRTILKQRNVKDVPKNIDDLLRNARYLEHQNFERRFQGDNFEKKSTRLQLNYRCGDDAKDTLFQILTKVKSEEQTLDIVFEKIINCVSKSLTQGTYYIKADLVTKRDLRVNNEVIFPSGTNFEVKKMDPFVDSYLSEFFSIFKESAISTFKEQYIDLYNELIDRIYNWLLSSNEAQGYLDKVKSQMGGIIYENDIIVPTEYIDLYWSNKGQKSCDEKRLSVRFRIKPGVSSIETYRLKSTDELIPVTKNVPNVQTEKIVCE